MNNLLTNPDKSKFDDKIVLPSGSSNNVELYIVGDAPDEYDVLSRKSFSGQSSELVRLALSKAGAEVNKVRFYNAVPYRPIYSNNQSEIVSRAPSLEEVEAYKAFLIRDLNKIKPKKILCVGRSAMSAFNIDESINSARTKTYEYLGIPVYATYHPTYVDRAGGESSKAFEDVVSDIKKIWNFDSSLYDDNEEGELVDIADVEAVRLALSKLQNCEPILDYEASSLNTLFEDFYLAGVGLRNPVTGYSCYIHVHSFYRSPLVFTPPEESKKLIAEFLSSRKVVVFNKQYENSATLGYFKVDLDSIDVLAWLRCLSMGSSLKDAASKLLGVRKWNDGVDQYNDLMEVICKSLMPTHKGNQRSELTDLAKLYDEGSLSKLLLVYEMEIPKVALKFANALIKESALGDILTFDKVEYKIDNYKTELEYLLGILEERQIIYSDLIQFDKFNLTTMIELALDKRQLACYKACSEFLDLMSKVMTEDELHQYDHDVFKFILGRGRNGFVINYGEIPLQLIRPYAFSDLRYTDKLKVHVEQMLIERGLVETAELYNRQAQLGFEMELNGIAWDDDHATRIREQYSDKATDTLKFLILHPRMRKILELNDSQVLSIQSAKDYEELKQYYNPSSNHATTRLNFSNLLLTPRIKFGLLLYAVHYESLSLSDMDLASTYPVLYSLYKKIISFGINADELKSMSEEDQLKARVYSSKKKVKFLDYCVTNAKVIQNNVYARMTKYKMEEATLFSKYSKYSLESTSSEHIEYFYQMFTIICGIHIDTHDTWFDEFEILYNFRLHKKVLKSKNSYVDGNVGRGVVQTIKSDTVRDRVSIRTHKYDGNKSDDEIYINQTSFGVNTAATHRFQSAAHTNPWNSELMDLRCSRFKDGLNLHYDYSANELRVLAKVANEETMLKAFEDGKDIHRYIAAKASGKPEDEITDAERRFSKMRCLHGSTRIKLLDGTSPAIKDLEGKKEFWVYSMDIRNNTYRPGKVLECAKTSVVRSYHKITLDDGSIINCTDDHRFLCRDGLYRKACNLSEGESLMPFNMRNSSTELGDLISGYEIIETPDGDEIYTHKMVTDSIHEGVRFPRMVRHHIDYNKRNNSPDNLRIMTWDDHNKLHHAEKSDQMKRAWVVDRDKYYKAVTKNLENFRSTESESDRTDRLTNFISWSDERREAQSLRMKEEGKDWTSSRQYRGLSSQIIQLVRNLLEYNLLESYDDYRPHAQFTRWETIPTILNCSYDDVVQSAWHLSATEKPSKLDTSVQSELGKSQMDYLWNSDDPEAMEFRSNHSTKQSVIMNRLNSSDEFQSNARRSKSLSFLKKVWITDPEVSELTYDLSKMKVDCSYRASLSKLVEYFGTFENALELAKVYNHSIAKIEIVDESADMYDLIVEDWHNFVIMTSDHSGVISSNSFSIIYGKGTRAFGVEFMAGDIQAAEKLYDDFFTEFPGVKTYIRSKHREALSTGQILTLFGNPILVGMPEEGLSLPDATKEIIIYDKEGVYSDKFKFSNDRNRDQMLRGKVGSALRNSQNYGIQSLGSQLAAIAAIELDDQFRRDELTNKITCFTHDSIDTDLQLINLPFTLRELPKYAVDYPKERFGIPLAIDYELGVSCDQLVGLNNTVVDDKFIKTGFEGKKSSLEKLIRRLESYGVRTKVDIHKQKEKLQSLEELFISKRAYALSFGTKYVELEGELELDFTNAFSAY